ncbi:MAG: ABC transporter permease [Eubacteriaceae bacterium]|jgi:ABC-2 type transport system permease protein|nr:ABC transporter permease [Eubacteriaceae bacterium]
MAKQIQLELKMLFYSRFIIIMAALVLACSIGIPVIQKLSYNRMLKANPYSTGAMAIDYMSGGSAQSPITINGVTVDERHPLYYEIKYMSDSIIEFESNKTVEGLADPEAKKTALLMLEDKMKFLTDCAQSITQWKYTVNLVYSTESLVFDQYIYSALAKPGANTAHLKSAYAAVTFMDDFQAKFLDLPETERAAKLESISTRISGVVSLLKTDDIEKFVNLSKMSEQDNSDRINAQIEQWEQEIVASPLKEETLSAQIEDMRRQIKYIEEVTIPILDYRLKYKVLPEDFVAMWQNTAIGSLESNKSQLLNDRTLTQEEFLKQQYLIDQYKTYSSYTAAMKKNLNAVNEQISVAERSLNSGRADLSFVQFGARNMTFRFLQSSFIPMMLAVMVGGWVIANEYQNGTIRLLLIRPKSRTKILMAKFAAALIFCFAIYTLSILANALANGAVFGFSDYALPKYIPGAEQSFISFLLPKAAACFVPVLFSQSFAFVMSVLLRNTVVSIVVPTISYIACTIVTSMAMYQTAYSWIKYTPIPYFDISKLFAQETAIYGAQGNMLELSLPFGLLMLAGLAATCVAVSVMRFSRQEITN